MAKKNKIIVEEVVAPESEDLLEGSADVVDLVERVYGLGHQHSCQYRPEINQITGLVYCRTCGIQTGSILPDYITQLPLAEYARERSRYLGA